MLIGFYHRVLAKTRVSLDKNYQRLFLLFGENLFCYRLFLFSLENESNFITNGWKRLLICLAPSFGELLSVMLFYHKPVEELKTNPKNSIYSNIFKLTETVQYQTSFAKNDLTLDNITVKSSLHLLYMNINFTYN